MIRQDLICMARMQLEAAKEYRRWALYYRLNGSTERADEYRRRAKLCLQCARLFQQDAHTEQFDTLKLRAKP